MIILSNTDEVIGCHGSDHEVIVLRDHIVKDGRMVREITPEERTCDVHIRGLHRLDLEDGLVVPTVSIGVLAREDDIFFPWQSQRVAPSQRGSPQRIGHRVS